jgi:hypothetical protein
LPIPRKFVYRGTRWWNRPSRTPTTIYLYISRHSEAWPKPGTRPPWPHFKPASTKW